MSTLDDVSDVEILRDLAQKHEQCGRLELSEAETEIGRRHATERMDLGKRLRKIAAKLEKQAAQQQAARKRAELSDEVADG